MRGLLWASVIKLGRTLLLLLLLPHGLAVDGAAQSILLSSSGHSLGGIWSTRMSGGEVVAVVIV